MLNLNSQSVRLGTGQKVHFLKTEPEVGIGGSKPSFVVGPRQIPVESVAMSLLNHDPTKYGHDRHKSCLVWYSYVNSEVRCYETYKKIYFYNAIPNKHI